MDLGYDKHALSFLLVWSINNKNSVADGQALLIVRQKQIKGTRIHV